MEKKLEDYYKKWKEVDFLIKRRTDDQNEIYDKLMETNLGKFYFSLTDEQKNDFRGIYCCIDCRDYYHSDLYKYCSDSKVIEIYHEILHDTETDALCNDDFPFKDRGLDIYIKDGVDTYNALTDESTKDLKVSAEVKLFIQNIINDLYGFNDNLTVDDIPVIKVIYDKLTKREEDFPKTNSVTAVQEIILDKVKRIHTIDKKNITYKENKRNVIADLKEKIDENETEIRNSDSGFKYLLLFLVETAKYEVSLLEGKRVTALLKEIEESNMSESDKDYFKDALIKAYYNLTNIEFRKQSKYFDKDEGKYFDNDNDICYATFETANPEINKRLIKMRQG